ncbi:alpha/beta hydrolase [Iodidimonas sp. SYSU 1G8]|uniref:alpha/beta fold hydrolase n=1 Tax=Iodidimonas sp. SYSU 1G8 TaxID=3133967 RepID=UPI0031FE5111
MDTGFVTSADGTRLFYRDSGQSDLPAILFIHGFLQNSLSWQFQLDDPELGDAFRLVAFDLRGHGQSGKPEAPEAYLEARRWSEDVSAVLDGLGIDRAVLVGWSYGGYVIADHLRHAGPARAAGLVMVGTSLHLGGEAAARILSPDVAGMFPRLVSSNPAKNMPALQAFAGYLTAEPMPESLYYECLGYAAVVPPHARFNILHREADNTALARESGLPVLVPHGSADMLMPLSAGEHVAASFPQARLSVYEGTGHSPFMEEMDRFNAELFTFAAASFA